MIFDINSPVNSWNSFFSDHSISDNLMLFFSRESDMIWFTSNYLQVLINEKECEVAPIYGKGIVGLEDFVEQLNLLLPIGHKLANNSNSLYDALLNFETEPSDRYIIWNNAEYLLNENENDFETILELMAVSSFLNTNGIATLKEDGSPYQVNQKNIFIFHGVDSSVLDKYTDKEYKIMAYDEELKPMVLDFTKFIIKE